MRIARQPLLRFLFCFALAAVPFFPCISWAQEVRIGVVGPRTGPLASFWSPIEDGAVQAADRERAVLGRKIELIRMDDEGKTEVAVKIASQLRDEKVLGIIGHLSGGTTLAAARVYSNDFIPVLSPIAYIPESMGPILPNLIQLGASPEREVGISVTFFNKSLPKMRSVSLFVEEGAFGNRVVETFAALASRYKLSVMETRRFPAGSTEFLAQLTPYKPRPGEGIYFWGSPYAVPLFLGAWREKKLTVPLVLASPLGLLVPAKQIWEVAGDVYFAGLDYPAISPFVRDILKGRADAGIFGPFLHGYAAMQVLIYGIKKAGTTDGQKVVEAILRDTVPTVAGPFRFTPKGESTRATYGIFQFKGGGYVLAQSTGGGDCCPDYEFCCFPPPKRK